MTVTDAEEAYRAALIALNVAKANHRTAHHIAMRERDVLDNAIVAADDALSALRNVFIDEVKLLVVSTT